MKGKRRVPFIEKFCIFDIRVAISPGGMKGIRKRVFLRVSVVLLKNNHRPFPKFGYVGEPISVSGKDEFFCLLYSWLT